jgi:hypothetical protein
MCTDVSAADRYFFHSQIPLPNLHQGVLHGQQYFIGCRDFDRGFDKGHQSHSVPDNVEEQILVKLLANQPLSDNSEKESQPQQLCRIPLVYSPLPEIVPIFRSLAHAHMSSGATSWDHKESPRNTLPETSACYMAPTTAEDVIDEPYTKKVKKVRSRKYYEHR